MIKPNTVIGTWRFLVKIKTIVLKYTCIFFTHGAMSHHHHASLLKKIILAEWRIQSDFNNFLINIVRTVSAAENKLTNEPTNSKNSAIFLCGVTRGILITNESGTKCQGILAILSLTSR